MESGSPSVTSPAVRRSAGDRHDRVDLHEKLGPNECHDLYERARRVGEVAKRGSDELVTDVADSLYVSHVHDVPVEAHDVRPVSAESTQDAVHVAKSLPRLCGEVSRADQVPGLVERNLPRDEGETP